MSGTVESSDEHEKPSLSMSVSVVSGENSEESKTMTERQDLGLQCRENEEIAEPIEQSEENIKSSVTLSETDQTNPQDVAKSHCRFCAIQMDCRDLLDLSTEDIIGKYTKLLLYLKLDVDFSLANKLPKHACSSCHNMCLETYKFFLKVRKAQDELNVLYGNDVRVQFELEHEMSEKNQAMEIDVIQKMVIGKGIIKTELDDSYEDAHAGPSAVDSDTHGSDIDNSDSESKETTKETPTLKTLLKQPKKEVNDEESTSTKLPKKTTYKIKKPVQVRAPRKKAEAKNVTFSWASYIWSCDHCKAECNTMEELRLHSRYTHSCCYGFSCVDCNDEFNTFNAFVEHVRTHREYLRLFCQYCNKKFRNKAECVLHALTHWSGTQKICELCGEIFPNQEALRQHKSSYRPKSLSHNTRRKKPRVVKDNLGSWNEYVWSCQDCYQLMPNIHALRSHAREVHSKCFSMKCCDCLRVHRSHGELVRHVHGHRPNLKHFCQYCNQYFEFPEELDTHIDEHYSGSQKPCYGCGEIFQNDELLRKHIFEFGALRRPGPHSEEDVTCDVCSKNCLTVGKLKIHRRIHEYKERCFVCDTCGNSYFNYWTYQSHIKVHGERSEICKICKKGFPTKVKLKNHAKTHLDDRPFTCDQCNNSFKTKNKLTRHKMIHTDTKPYVCVICDKSFRQKNGLKVHSAQHTGVRPYQCEFCDRTFTNNPNRDKHMRRRHGVPLYKAKEVPQEVTDKKAKEWLTQVTANQKKRKDTSEGQGMALNV